MLDSVATFTAVEVFPFARLVRYAVLSALLALPRPDLKKRVVDSPDVLSALAEAHPALPELLNALYEGRYAAFLVALADVSPDLASDRYMAPHAGYYVRALRVAAYRQYLESYRSVTITGMATAFGVRSEFLDAELSRFIASGRVNAKIDAVDGEACVCVCCGCCGYAPRHNAVRWREKVRKPPPPPTPRGCTGVIETTRPDAKNAQYIQVIKNGDALLNKLQRLSRVVAS